MEDRNFYSTDESEEYKEEVGGAFLRDGGDEFSVMPVVYPRGTSIVSSLGYFSSVGSSSKNSNTSLPLSLGVHRIQEYFNKKRGGKRKCIKPQD